MKQVLVLLAFLGAASAGVQTLTGLASLEKLRQFANLCQSGKVPPTGANIGGVQYYCKGGSGVHQESTEHKVTADLGKGLDQTVFVQPPSRELTHLISIDGVGEGGKTNVIVVPGKVDNKYQIGVTPRITVNKPSISYVQDASDSQSQHRGSQDTFHDV